MHLLFFKKARQAHYSFWLGVFLFVQACRPGATGQLTIESNKVFDSIPSASGIALAKDSIYIVGDDATGIYKVALSDDHSTKILLRGLPFIDYREPKAVKHDFESACLLSWQGSRYLLAFGSGSNTSSRDSLLLLNAENNSDQKIISLLSFYKQLQELTHTDSTQWNIEGATVAGTNIVLANRGNNLLIILEANAFLSWLMKPGTAFPKIEHQKVTLPKIDGHEAKLSGLCTLTNEQLLFCASVEDTPDWTKDGPVLGSYFGIYSLKNKSLVQTSLLKNSEGNPLKEKIESLEILERLPGKGIRFLAVGDNDNGTSNLFQIKW